MTVLFRALEDFRAAHDGRLPRGDDLSPVLERVRELCAPLVVEDDVADFVRLLGAAARFSLQPFAAFFGGLAAQEAVKAVTAVGAPLRQLLYHNFFEAVPDDLLARDAATDAADAWATTRYADQAAFVGAAAHEALQNLRLFVVGAGALGCELLCHAAAIGIGAGPDGCVSVADADWIERSNTSRQRLFLEADLGANKALTAARALRALNGDVCVEAAAEMFTYRDAVLAAPCDDAAAPVAFCSAAIDRADVVVSALDSAVARNDVSAACRRWRRSQLNAGTDALKACTSVHEVDVSRPLRFAATDATDAAGGGGGQHCVPPGVRRTFEQCVATAVTKFADYVAGARGGPGAALAADASADERTAAARALFDELFTADVELMRREERHGRRIAPLAFDALQRDHVAFVETTAALLGRRAAFDKDNDAHVDFVVAYARLLASCVDGLDAWDAAADRNRFRLVAARIVPALATTTSVATSLLAVELLKRALGKPSEAHCGYFVDLGDLARPDALLDVAIDFCDDAAAAAEWAEALQVPAETTSMGELAAQLATRYGGVAEGVAIDVERLEDGAVARRGLLTRSHWRSLDAATMQTKPLAQWLREAHVPCARVSPAASLVWLHPTLLRGVTRVPLPSVRVLLAHATP